MRYFMLGMVATLGLTTGCDTIEEENGLNGDNGECVTLDHWEAGAPFITDAGYSCDNAEWYYWADLEGWTSDSIIEAAHTEVTDPSHEWLEEHTLGVEDYGPDLDDYGPEECVPEAWEDLGVVLDNNEGVTGGYTSSESTIHACNSAHEGGMSWLVDTWDVDGNLADCVVWGHEPDYAFGDHGCEDLGS